MLTYIGLKPRIDSLIVFFTGGGGELHHVNRSNHVHLLYFLLDSGPRFIPNIILHIYKFGLLYKDINFLHAEVVGHLNYHDSSFDTDVERFFLSFEN